MKKKALLVSFVLVLLLAVFISIRFYSFVFARRVQGEILGVERVAPEGLIGAPGTTSAQLFSFAVAIRELESGEIFTASSEDRQWAIAQKGYCAEAKFYPYPFWQLERGGTYHNARLIRLYDCPPGTRSLGAPSPSGATPSPAQPPSGAPGAPQSPGSSVSSETAAPPASPPGTPSGTGLPQPLPAAPDSTGNALPQPLPPTSGTAPTGTLPQPLPPPSAPEPSAPQAPPGAGR